MDASSRPCALPTGLPVVNASRLKLLYDTSPLSPLLPLFFEAYDDAFILEDEKEDIEGFRKCLALNSGTEHERLTGKWGAFKETIAVAVASVDGVDTMVGGANFICFRIGDDLGSQSQHRRYLSLNLNYIFIHPAFRGRGYFRQVLGACVDMARQQLAAGSTDDHARDLHLIFTEQNDPFRMDPDDYVRDSVHSGVDQIDRIAIWSHVGARIIDFEYFQPALSGTQKAFDGLLLAVIGAPDSGLAADMLRQHLQRFFAISVLKGAPVEQNKSAASQLQRLDRLGAEGAVLGLYDGGPWAAANKGYDPRSQGQAMSLLSLLRSQAHARH
ncbi:MAG: hypothetical protein WCA45_12655 [Thiobacillaceae bacterium]